MPIAIQRIDEVNDVYLKTVYTLGATPWQMIRTVYFPSVISRLFSDIRILTAISWTYIVIAESIGGEAGIGALTWQVGLRRGRIDKVFCLLIIIMLVGILQDKLFAYFDRKLFPFKYQAESPGSSLKQPTSSYKEIIFGFSGRIIVLTMLLGYFLLILDEYVGIFGHINLLSYLFRDTVWVFHLLWLLLVWTLSGGMRKKIRTRLKQSR